MFYTFCINPFQYLLITNLLIFQWEIFICLLTIQFLRYISYFAYFSCPSPSLSLSLSFKHSHSHCYFSSYPREQLTSSFLTLLLFPHFFLRIYQVNFKLCIYYLYITNVEKLRLEKLIFKKKNEKNRNGLADLFVNVSIIETQMHFK